MRKKPRPSTPLQNMRKRGERKNVHKKNELTFKQQLTPESPSHSSPLTKRTSLTPHLCFCFLLPSCSCGDISGRWAGPGGSSSPRSVANDNCPWHGAREPRPRPSRGLMAPSEWQKEQLNDEWHAAHCRWPWRTHTQTHWLHVWWWESLDDVLAPSEGGLQKSHFLLSVQHFPLNHSSSWLFVGSLAPLTYVPVVTLALLLPLSGAPPLIYLPSLKKISVT